MFKKGKSYLAWYHPTEQPVNAGSRKIGVKAWCRQQTTLKELRAL